MILTGPKPRINLKLEPDHNKVKTRTKLGLNYFSTSAKLQKAGLNQV